MDKEKLINFFKELMSKKYIANILVFLGVAIMALIVSKDLLTDSNRGKNTYNINHENTVSEKIQQEIGQEELIELKLENILKKIRGVGDVQVMVTFEMGTELIPASNVSRSKDTTEENDSNGGSRIVTSEDITETIVVANEVQGSKPLVLKEIKPRVNGVIVVAEGVDNIEVKAALYDAVKTVLQIPGHKVQVYSKK